MNEEIIGIEVGGEIYPIKDEETSGKAQTLETKISTVEEKITNLETASTEHGEKIAQIEANIGETDIQELKSLVDAHDEELKELAEMIDDTTISETKTWSSEKINDALEDIEKETGDVYSEEETVCGKWIDGSTLYRKVFHFPTYQLDGQTNINHNISNLKFVTRLDYSFSYGGYFYTQWDQMIQKICDTQAIRISAGTLYVTNLNIIMEYTKTTD